MSELLTDIVELMPPKRPHIETAYERDKLAYEREKMMFDEVKKRYDEAKERFDEVERCFFESQKQYQRSNGLRGDFDRGDYEVTDNSVYINLHHSNGFGMTTIPIPTGTNFHSYITRKIARIMSVHVLDTYDKDGSRAWDGRIDLEITSPNRNFQVGVIVVVSFTSSFGRRTYMTSDLPML